MSALLRARIRVHRESPSVPGIMIIQNHHVGRLLQKGA
jgi:hypothetical protein